METILKHYLRKKPSRSNAKGEPYGVLVAKAENGEIIFGWSLCHRKDLFDKQYAVAFATERILVPSHCTPAAYEENIKRLPHDVKKSLPKFLERCKKYFKQVQSI